MTSADQPLPPSQMSQTAVLTMTTAHIKISRRLEALERSQSADDHGRSVNFELRLNLIACSADLQQLPAWLAPGLARESLLHDFRLRLVAAPKRVLLHRLLIRTAAGSIASRGIVNAG
jgi:hypothetical protein